MPNGKHGDHPFTDITLWGLRVYSPQADALVREIAELGGKEEVSNLLWDQYNPLNHPDIRKLERVLTGIRDRLKRAAQ